MNNRVSRKTFEVTQNLDTACLAFADRISIKQVASQIFMREQTLTDRLNPNRETHRLGAEDIINLHKATGDSILLEGLCSEMGFTIYETPAGEVTEETIVKLNLKRGVMLGLFNSLLDEALEDDVIEQHELPGLIQSAKDGLAVLTKKLANLEAMQASKGRVA